MRKHRSEETKGESINEKKIILITVVPHAYFDIYIYIYTYIFENFGEGNFLRGYRGLILSLFFNEALNIRLCKVG
jgi:hypothetical protein